MADRKTLRPEHLKNFKSWLTMSNHPHRDGRGDHQVLQVKVGTIWAAIYKRAGAEHLTVQREILPLLSAFLYWRREESIKLQKAISDRFDAVKAADPSSRKTRHAVGELQSAANQLGDAKAGILKACELFRAAGIDHHRSTMAAQKLADAVAILNREIQFFNQTGGNHD
ncbi:hypothetical protein SUSUWATARI_00240 [Serratia phage vB_SmaM-Susuwatari]|nr:hypothetical protein SUSUWATARI_00240 [Serratia phage vB_SmaM-Susuwatari]